MQGIPDGPPLAGARLDLEPLRVEHAEEMAPLLDDSRLHTFIGGEPAGLPALRARYERQVVGHSADGSEQWLNWVVRRRSDGQAVGTVQATITEERQVVTAEVAWVIATKDQGHGYARESAQILVSWLRDRGVTEVIAHVHPEHVASQRVARAVGLSPTSTVVDGEVRWRDVGAAS